jgi:hypothetical protein
MPAVACVVPPDVSIATSPEPFIKDADIVFRGRLDQVSTDSPRSQTALFSVVAVAKGPDLDSVVILNQFTTSCSRPFQGIGKEFWVLAVENDTTGSYTINSRGGFVPMATAEQFGFDPIADL